MGGGRVSNYSGLHDPTNTMQMQALLGRRASRAIALLTSSEQKSFNRWDRCSFLQTMSQAP